MNRLTPVHLSVLTGNSRLCALATRFGTVGERRDRGRGAAARSSEIFDAGLGIETVRNCEDQRGAGERSKRLLEEFRRRRRRQRVRARFRRRFGRQDGL
ncbi:hypothetical protein HPP92_020814 [Vanilla planifolia]|uniref:Uncharacterized protein n=1 Tax=Vanilla planifolia TaxID=51239 RepID=A0A835Q1G8_VANPL|nr:hypothetical protein HPP92_021190 [Vanilla planifolia]KAG0462338.1 hypothetical protein HPP92_020814 [Vanilla planifolia]